MRRLVCFCIIICLATNPEQLNAQRRSFNRNWKFSLQANDQASFPNFDDKSWRELHVPHDWGVEGEYAETNGDWQSGYLPAGIGWYRKTFQYGTGWSDKRVSIVFDGVYMNSEVWINGKLLGKRPNGYIGFRYDLTSYLVKGKNLIAVKVDHSKPKSARWYTGNGIYRNVWLDVRDKTHLQENEIFITSTVAKNTATAILRYGIENSGTTTSTLQVRAELNGKDGRLLQQKTSAPLKLLPGQNASDSLTIDVLNSRLWSPDNPYLYQANLVLLRDGKKIDELPLKFGIRTFEFSSTDGCHLNGAALKFKGVCLHQDAGAVGVAVPDQLLLNRLVKLKTMGCNAIRTAHHPFNPVFYNYCDSLGLMVMNEAFDGWETPKAQDDYGNYFIEWWERDLSDFIRRDRNHPSVVLWSIGNEVPKPKREIQQKLINLIHHLDPTRPVTQGGIDPTRGMNDQLFPTLLDVKGFNGDGEEMGVYEKYHEQFPAVPMLGTEVPHTYQTRGFYKTTTTWRRKDFPAVWEIKGGNAGTMKGLTGKLYPLPDLVPAEVFPEAIATVYYQNDSVFKLPGNDPWVPDLYYQSSYDNATVRSSARKAWQRTVELPFVMGQFRWTGFDYLGETNQWPSRFANFGILDICGFPKDHYMLYKSLWTQTPMVHLLPHWTHPGKEGVAIPVVVYTNCDSVQLLLNGKPLGMKIYTGEQLVWQVRYTPGKLEAVAYKKGFKKITAIQQTAGTPKRILISSDKSKMEAGGEDIIICEITIADENGVAVPDANDFLTFEVNGAATLKAADNGDPLDVSAYRFPKRRAFKGKCLLILSSAEKPGITTLKISADKLPSALVQFQTVK